MLKACVITLACVIIATFCGGSFIRRDSVDADENAYYKTATIKGLAIIANHPTLGQTPASSTFLVFQRVDCSQATFGVWTDLSGRYELRVGTGRYKLIVRDGTREKQTYDVLAPGQRRIVDTGPPGTITKLDVTVIVPDK